MLDLKDIRGLGRGHKVNPPAQIRKLSDIMADRVCGRHNKDAKIFLVGSQGSGKSHSAIYGGIKFGEAIAARIGGTWEDYFPRDLSHVFIGDPEGHATALKNIRKHCIYILDDAGVSINARNFMTSYNKSLNDIFQTVRTDNAIIIINAPDSFLIDYVPRTIVSHYGEVSESMHSKGLNFIKLFKIERKFREGKTHYHHYQFGNTQVIRWRFGDIPADMAAAYEILRDKATQRIKSKAGGKQDKEEAATRQRQAYKQAKEDHMMAIYTLYSTGTTISKAVSQTNKANPEFKTSRQNFDHWMIEKGFK
jgi:hypothetical protein